jgi:hypothetical protein
MFSHRPQQQAALIPSPNQMYEKRPSSAISTTRLDWLAAMLRIQNLVLTAILVGGLVTAALLYSRSSSLKPLEAGGIFPKAAATDIDGKSILWPAGPFFVVYTRFDSEMGVQLEKYLRLQLQRHNQMLAVVTIVPGGREEVAELVRQTGNASGILHDDGKWRKRLELGDSGFRLFLIDQNSHITFATDYANPDDLRQLSEKALTGRIKYSSVDQTTGLRTGDRFAGFGAVDMRTGEKTVFTSATKSSVICFTSHCPECDLEEEIGRYALHESQSLGRSPSTLLFSSRFSRTNLAKIAGRYGIKARLLQATENIPGLEDPLSLETFSPAEIVQLDLAAGGMVEHITYWNLDNNKRAGQL